jgi:hypothetical protein
MNQNTSGNNYRKRNFTSPQKTQASIVVFTNQKAQVQKKHNSNITAPRSAIERSQTAILGIRSLPQANKSTSNNPYHALSLNAEEDDEQGPEDIIAEEKPQAMNSEEESSLKEEDVESLETESSTPERKLLSKKARQTLRKIRSLKKVLMDNAGREELAEVLGNDFVPTAKFNTKCSNPEKVEKATVVCGTTQESGPSLTNDPSKEDVEMVNVESEAKNLPQRTLNQVLATEQTAPTKASSSKIST